MTEQEFKIDDDVPFETPEFKYPFEKLKVGQSFFVSGGTRDKLSNKLTKFHRMNPSTRLRTKHRIENEIEGLRIWRLS